MSEAHRPVPRALLVVPVLLALLATQVVPAQTEATVSRSGEPAKRDSSCVTCHDGIEDMHPEAQLSCVDCHGGDPDARQKFLAHVQPQSKATGDESVAALDEDLAWRRFKNPMDLRVVDRTCAQCHEAAVEHLASSLHGTTAGHLSDGYYEVGLLEEKGSVYSIFENFRRETEASTVDGLVPVPAFRDNLPEDELATHFTDLVRKECMQCHLYSEGRAVRGRVGFDGDYRGEGCAACHVPYSLDGLSESADAQALRTEPGHPRVHAMTTAPTTETCTSCHYGDASIGLAFRGLSQLPPGAPGGPEVPGTTEKLLNRQFYLRDTETCPPDVHHERGMHCIDCHTQSDVMGNGDLHGSMEHAVEISCEACHGTFDAPSSLRTERGRRLEHLKRETQSGTVTLTSKVTGKEHVVPQVVHVLDPKRPEYNKDAARAMNGAHEGIECYTCHAGWNVNFLGFHFDRNESFEQLDLLSGKRTPGRVTTQEKVFSTWKSFYAGLNEAGRVAPYMTGFSTMGSVTDEDGNRILDQVFPVTQAGLSGLTMIHHQTHTVRPTARSCVECHRTSSTWGMGSVNFRLGRQIMYVADRRGIESVAVHRSQLGSSIPLSKVVQPDVVALELACDPLQGFGETLFALEGGRGLHVFDVRDPRAPRRLDFIATVNPLALELAGDTLYVADGIGGLRIFDVSDPEEIVQVGLLPMFEAHDVDVQWPFAYVADGPGGLAICDVRVPSRPRFVSGLGVSPGENAPDAIVGVETIFQYSRPRADRKGRPSPERTRARNLAVVLDETTGMAVIDVTEPTRPELLYPHDRRSGARNDPLYTGLAVKSHVDLAEATGGQRTFERDYAYVLLETGGPNNRRTRMVVMDLTNPVQPRFVERADAGFASEGVEAVDFYNAPFVQNLMFVPGLLGVLATDVTVSARPTQVGALPGLVDCYVVEMESFPLDRTIDEFGNPLKDVSHAGSRWLQREEVARILDVPADALGLIPPDARSSPIPGHTARLHFAELDRDGNGVLTDKEFEKGGGRVADRDGDGRITLVELARSTGTLRLRRSVVEEVEESPFDVERVGENGDLARLLDGTDPSEFDRNDDWVLERQELQAAFFAALDLDGDKRLTPAELSRHPGELRQLRYGGEWAEKRFRKLDLNKDGKLSGREFRIQDRDFEALDRNDSGGIQLTLPYDPQRIARGDSPPPSEWPLRRRAVLNLSPVATFDQVMTTFDRDEDGELSRRELKRRPDLMANFDRDGDQVATTDEVRASLDLIGRFGAEVTADDFATRWDLDGDGRIDETELPPGPYSSRISTRLSK